MPADDHDGPAPEAALDTAHLPPVFRAPWYSSPRWYHLDLDSSTFGEDAPEALRASGPVRVAEALAGLVTWGEAAPRKDIREICSLIREWLETDAGRHDDLAADIGLRPRDGRRSLANAAARAERDAALLILARQAPWAAMPARDAARSLRAEFDRFRATAAVARLTRPPIEPGATWWRIARLRLAHPMPSLDRLAMMLKNDRRDI